MNHLSRILSAIFALVSLSVSSYAQEHVTVLKDGWQYHRGGLGGPWEGIRKVQKGKPESTVQWEDVTLPHCFNGEDSVDPDEFYYQGDGWYRTSLNFDNPYPDGRIILHFEGAGQVTEVYVHTTLAARHVGGYDEWEADITDEVAALLASGKDLSLTQGRIPILVFCNNRRNLETIPSDMSDFSLYGGLYRPVRLEYRPALNMSGIKVITQTPEDLASGKVDISMDINGLAVPSGKKAKGPAAWVNVKITDPAGKLVADEKYPVAAPGKKQAPGFGCSLDLSAPALWSPAEPQLYTVSITLDSPSGRQVDVRKVGFRHFEFKQKGPFYINGKRLLLRGTHRHEDHALTAGAMTEELQLREMQMIRDMGANFIRLGHYQQSDRILQLCDSLGIIVWEEIPWCRGGVGGPEYREQAHRMLHNMITQHAHHISVVMWGMGNENDWPGDFETFENDEIRAFMKSLHDQAHAEDPSRVTCIRRCEFAKDIIDVYSPSMWAGWYTAKYDIFHYRDLIRDNWEQTDRLFHAEWGGDSMAGRHDDTWELKGGEGKGWYSETYIVQLVDWCLHEQEHMDWFSGAAFWTFKDFCTPLRPDNPVPYVNQKGAVARDLTPKEIYYVFQSYWASKPMLHIYGHTWPVRWGEAGEAKKMLVFSNASKVELFLNGESMGVKTRDNDDYPAAGFHWDLVLREGANTVKAVAAEEGLEDEICFEYQTAKWGAPAVAELACESLGGGRCKVNVVIKDENGVPCLDARPFIRYSLAGRGELEDNAGTPWASRYVQAVNGRSSIVVSGEPDCVVGVAVDGLPVSYVTIK